MAEEKKIVLEVEVEEKKATRQLGRLDKSIQKLQGGASELTGKMQRGFGAVGKGAKGAVKGVKGLAGGFKSLAAATGFVFILTEIFATLKELLMGNQKVANALGKAFGTVEIVFNNVFGAVSNLIDELRNLSSFSLTDVFNAFTNFGSAVASAGDGALETADKLVRLRNEVQLAEAQQGLLMLEYQREAEIQRQIRDDVSLTIEARQEANVRLGQILDEQANEELKLANKRKELADLELSINKDSIENQVAVIDAQKEIADINERITGQRSEQLTNENSLKLEGVAMSEERIKKLEEEAAAEAEAANKIAAAKIKADQTVETYLAERRGLSREEQMQAEINAALDAEFKKEQAAIAAATQLMATEQELEEIRLAAVDENLRLENEIRARYAAEDEKLAEETAAALAKIEEDKAAKVKEEEEAKQAYREAGLAAASSIVGSLGQLAALMAREGAESIALQKTLAIAQVAIDTASSISSAIAGATASATATGAGAVVTTPVFIATQVATVLGALAQVGTILASVPGPSATIPGPSSVSTPASPAPAFDPVATNTTELGGAQQAQLAPIQAFVIETEMTGNQNNISQIENQVTFGIDG
jgi:hypothetical protein